LAIKIKRDIVFLGFWQYGFAYGNRNIRLKIKVLEDETVLEECEVVAKKREFVKWGICKIAPIKFSKPIHLMAGSEICLGA